MIPDRSEELPLPRSEPSPSEGRGSEIEGMETEASPPSDGNPNEGRGSLNDHSESDGIRRLSISAASASASQRKKATMPIPSPNPDPVTPSAPLPSRRAASLRYVQMNPPTTPGTSTTTTVSRRYSRPTVVVVSSPARVAVNVASLSIGSWTRAVPSSSVVTVPPPATSTVASGTPSPLAVTATGAGSPGNTNGEVTVTSGAGSSTDRWTEIAPRSARTSVVPTRSGIASVTSPFSSVVPIVSPSWDTDTPGTDVDPTCTDAVTLRFWATPSSNSIDASVATSSVRETESDGMETFISSV
ncbi:MAG: hypothetical protein BRD21_05820 [Halobacteriales archaeon SW_8_66_22]|nr:MAG: hypothetical protein BRD21_05820 [Halobacteriales archaeon SW_8_66_22]